MNVNSMVFMIAGLMVLNAAFLTLVHSPNWIWMSYFIGINMFQSAFTGFCPLAIILKKLGVKE